MTTERLLAGFTPAEIPLTSNVPLSPEDRCPRPFDFKETGVIKKLRFGARTVKRDMEEAKVRTEQLLTSLILTLTATASATAAAPQMVVVEERTVMVQEPPPHGKIGMSTANRIRDQVPNRAMEFRKRVLHPGAAIGEHVIAHDEVYYVLSGEGEVVSDGKPATWKAGSAATLYTAANVGLWQRGTAPLVLIIAYPVVK